MEVYQINSNDIIIQNGIIQFKEEAVIEAIKKHCGGRVKSGVAIFF